MYGEVPGKWTDGLGEEKRKKRGEEEKRGKREDTNGDEWSGVEKRNKERRWMMKCRYYE